MFATPSKPYPRSPVDLASLPQEEEAVNTSLPTSVNNQKLVVAGLNNTPLLDRIKVNKYVTYLLLATIAGVFVLDGLIIWKRKTMRVSGHNLAHIIFFLGLISAVWISYRGTIL